MTNLQLIEILRDYIGDLEKLEDERAAKYIRLNQGNEEVRKERTTQRNSYNAALYSVSCKLSELRMKVKEA